MNEATQMTELLRAYAEGDSSAFDQLAPLIYEHLRRIAHAQLAQQQRNTLDTTALVHEAYLKLAGGKKAPWRDRDHFYAACAQAMRHVLVDAARRRLSHKRGDGANAVTLPTDLLVPEEQAAKVLAVHEALVGLKKVNPELSSVVECRFFAGYSGAETAHALGVSERTAHRHWQRARAWLKLELGAAAPRENEPLELETRRSGRGSTSSTQ